MTSQGRAATVRGAVLGASLVVAAGAGVSAVATIYARRLVTPDAEKPDDVEVLAVGSGTVTLRATPETIAKGRYGLWLDGGAGHARVGEVID
ncbi:MAG: alpha/beta hydrolase, partial [Kineosporiaceae bacterium]